MMMDESFNFKDVPYNWGLCYIAECSRKEECMRYQVCASAPDEVTKNPCVLLIKIGNLIMRMKRGGLIKTNEKRMWHLA